MALAEIRSDIVAGLGVNGFVGGTGARSADMNQYVLQNLMWLMKRPYALVADFDGTVFSTASNAFQNTGIAATLTTTGGRVLVVAFGSVLISNSATSALLTIYEDGVNQGHSVFGMGQFVGGSNSRIGFAFPYLTNTAPSAASHTWTLYARSLDNVNSITILTAQMWALEIGA